MLDFEKYNFSFCHIESYFICIKPKRAPLSLYLTISFIGFCLFKCPSKWFMVKPRTSDIQMTYEYIRVAYGWHRSDTRMTYEYIQVMYGWHTSTYERHTDVTLVHTTDIRMAYEYIKIKYERIQMTCKWHANEISNRIKDMELLNRNSQNYLWQKHCLRLLQVIFGYYFDSHSFY